MKLRNMFHYHIYLIVFGIRTDVIPFEIKDCEGSGVILYIRIIISLLVNRY